MSAQRPDSGISMDYSDDRSVRFEMDTPDTGVGSENGGKAESKSQHRQQSAQGSEGTATNHRLAAALPPPTADGVNVDNEGSAKADDEIVPLPEKADWTSNTLKHRLQASPSPRKDRSYSVQLDSPASQIGVTLTNRRASTAFMGRSSGYLSEEDEVSRPASGFADKMRSRRPSYANVDGVQLRGDKGKTRRRSTASALSQSSLFNAAALSNEWKKSFEVPYAPRRKATKIVRGIIAPPRIGKLNHEHDLGWSGSQDKCAPRGTLPPTRRSYNHISKHGFQSTPKPKHIDIHYEDFLPKNDWLEMKPKRFTRNHKHGNHFELRKMDEESMQSGDESQPKKEAFVWENAYQIWLMEKTHVD